MNSAAAQDVLLDKQAPASDERRCTRIALGRTGQDCHAAMTISLRAPQLPPCWIVNGFVNETRRNGLGGVERCVMAETGGWR
jgi:hypothetical protein